MHQLKNSLTFPDISRWFFTVFPWLHATYPSKKGKMSQTFGLQIQKTFPWWQETRMELPPMLAEEVIFSVPSTCRPVCLCICLDVWRVLIELREVWHAGVFILLTDYQSYLQQILWDSGYLFIHALRLRRPLVFRCVQCQSKWVNWLKSAKR